MSRALDNIVRLLPELECGEPSETQQLFDIILPELTEAELFASLGRFLSDEQKGELAFLWGGS